jgi:hypothetical protein
MYRVFRDNKGDYLKRRYFLVGLQYFVFCIFFWTSTAANEYRFLWVKKDNSCCLQCLLHPEQRRPRAHSILVVKTALSRSIVPIMTQSCPFLWGCAEPACAQYKKTYMYIRLTAFLGPSEWCMGRHLSWTRNWRKLHPFLRAPRAAGARNICVGFADVSAFESGAYVTHMLRTQFAYDVRHVARVIMQCCAHLPHETRNVTIGPLCARRRGYGVPAHTLAGMNIVLALSHLFGFEIHNSISRY